jgi:hypothetical protein
MEKIIEGHGSLDAQRRANRARHGKLNKQKRIITALRLSAMLALNLAMMIVKVRQPDGGDEKCE